MDLQNVNGFVSIGVTDLVDELLLLLLWVSRGEFLLLIAGGSFGDAAILVLRVGDEAVLCRLA